MDKESYQKIVKKHEVKNKRTKNALMAFLVGGFVGILANFFYDILPTTLSKIIKYSFWNKNDKIFLWTGFLNNPIKYGKISHNKEILKLFERYRKYSDFQDKDEQELLKNKINWFEKYYV